MVERAAQIDRKDPRVLLREAVLKQQRGQINEAESQFRELLANSAADVLTRVRAAYDLAGILDGAGQYDEAMTALLEGKAIQRAQAGPLAAPLQQMQKLHQEMAAHHHQSHSGPLACRLPASFSPLGASPCSPAILVPAPPCSNRCSMRTAKSLVWKRRR